MAVDLSLEYVQSSQHRKYGNQINRSVRRRFFVVVNLKNALVRDGLKSGIQSRSLDARMLISAIIAMAKRELK